MWLLDGGGTKGGLHARPFLCPARGSLLRCTAAACRTSHPAPLAPLLPAARLDKIYINGHSGEIKIGDLGLAVLAPRRFAPGAQLPGT